MIKIFGRRKSEPTCEEVMVVLQSYLDGEIDADTARGVAVHLERCERCGPEARVYQQIKTSLHLHALPVDAAVLASLEAFGRRLAAGE